MYGDVGSCNQITESHFFFFLQHWTTSTSANQLEQNVQLRSRNNKQLKLVHTSGTSELRGDRAATWSRSQGCWPWRVVGSIGDSSKTSILSQEVGLTVTFPASHMLKPNEPPAGSLSVSTVKPSHSNNSHSAFSSRDATCYSDTMTSKQATLKYF